MFTGKWTVLSCLRFGRKAASVLPQPSDLLTFSKSLGYEDTSGTRPRYLWQSAVFGCCSNTAAIKALLKARPPAKSQLSVRLPKVAGLLFCLLVLSHTWDQPLRSNTHEVIKDRLVLHRKDCCHISTLFLISAAELCCQYKNTVSIPGRFELPRRSSYHALLVISRIPKPMNQESWQVKAEQLYIKIQQSNQYSFPIFELNYEYVAS